MPPKKRRLEPRKKREHPLVERWVAISAVATSIAKLTRQKFQYMALLKQVDEITGHDQLFPDETQWASSDFELRDTADIHSFVSQWLASYIQNHTRLAEMRDKALKDLRAVDVLDDEVLKASASQLTEAEAKIAQLEHIGRKWERVVRYENKGSLQEHTEKWITRWLRQWQKMQVVMDQRMKQFQETLP